MIKIKYENMCLQHWLVRVTRSLVLCVVFCRPLFVLLSFFFWPFYCLFFFDLRILITSLWYLQTLLVDLLHISFLVIISFNKLLVWKFKSYWSLIFTIHMLRKRVVCIASAGKNKVTREVENNNSQWAWFTENGISLS